MKQDQINLAKHPHENRYLMCWYTIFFDGHLYEFRSEKVVSAADERKLREFHCTRMLVSSLRAGCLAILLPYLDQIKKHVKAEMAKPEAEGFPGPSVVKIK